MCIYFITRTCEKVYYNCIMECMVYYNTMRCLVCDNASLKTSLRRRSSRSLPSQLSPLVMHSVVIVVTLISVLYLSAVSGFSAARFSQGKAVGFKSFSIPPVSTSALSAKKPETPSAEESQYWQGEWVCADCGYIYDRDIDGGGLYFEQQKRGFICPQCR